MKRMLLLLVISLQSCLLMAGAEIDTGLQRLQTSWAQIQYQLPEREKDEAFSKLNDSVKNALALYPDSAELWIWSGIIKSTHASSRGGLGALSLVKSARADLEKAIELNGTALNGAAYTTLGSLYYQVPGWPIAFGNDKKARRFLLKGLELGSDDIDANFFYADFLVHQKDYAHARLYLTRAMHAPARTGRQLADEKRLAEATTLMKSIEKASP